jgi:predicted Fe-Mo cluster-binding NifX family protein
VARRVAVQDGLENVKQALQKQGIEVTKLVNGTMNNVDAAVVTGMSENAMGIADTNNKFPVVEANGMTAQEVVSTLQARWNRLQEEA